MFVAKGLRRGKLVSESAIAGERIELLHEASPHGIFFGGRILEIVDKIVLKVATLHAGRICVPEGVDFVRFLAPAKKEDVLICSAAVTRTWFFSMEIGVKVVAEDFRSLEQKDILFAYFTFTALDENGQPIMLSPIIPQNEEEKRRYLEADKRRRMRLKSSFHKTLENISV